MHWYFSSGAECVGFVCVCRYYEGLFQYRWYIHRIKMMFYTISKFTFFYFSWFKTKVNFNAAIATLNIVGNAVFRCDQSSKQRVGNS